VGDHVQQTRCRIACVRTLHTVSGPFDLIAVWSPRVRRRSTASSITSAATVSNVALDPRGRWIATAGVDGRIRVWSAKDIVPTRATYDFIAHRGDVQSLSYLRNGQALISLGRDGTLRLWKMPQLQRFDLHKSWVLDLDMSTGGRWLATASYDGYVHIIDLAGTSNDPIATVRVSRENARVKNVQFDPTDPHVIVTLARAEDQPERWRWDSGGRVERINGFLAQPRSSDSSLVSLDISQDGRRVAAGDSQGNVYIWDAHTGKLDDDPALTGLGEGASGIAFDPLGHMLAVTSPTGVRLKKLGTQEEPKLLELPDATTVAFDPRGEHIVGGIKGGVLRVWTRDGRPKHELVAHGSTVGSPSFSDDGKLVAVGTGEGLIEVWKVDSGRRVMLARQHGDAVNDVLFLSGGQSRLVSASDDSTVAVFKCDACEDPGTYARQVADEQ